MLKIITQVAGYRLRCACHPIPTFVPSPVSITAMAQTTPAFFMPVRVTSSEKGCRANTTALQ
ncbi:MAG: hypothetical protein RMZ41_028125 [Nostoc sp. DedVER02]|uniref:hypothetical protein n=1 Tax=unclassified Nostoc TaxID=2593658 RepID=UPI002AD4D4CE|nr:MULTISPECIES: hypothetical protein [unclassified Nostoc]MDZ7989394.1 hypothetical protein [Nostoc sp. DedVER02]MDZ8112305.1 hypothetical protein [Nostoc sp. DedVER01b]